MATPVADAAPAPGPMAPRPFAVARRVRETDDTWTLTLEAVDAPSPVVAPGQFVMVYVFGIGEVPISVSGTCGDTRLVLTVRAVGAVTNAICATAPGAVLGVRGPFGSAWPVAEAAGRDVVVVAGGIGLAPLRPVVAYALRRRPDFGEVVVLYGARTPADLLFPRELEEWRAAAVVDVTVDTADAGWRGRVGVASALLPRARFDAGSATAFVCGPEIMMRFTTRALLERGLAPDRIHVSLERNMRCGVGHCGHCQLGPTLICRDGPVYSYATAAPWLEAREL